MPAIVPPTHREERPLCALHRGLLTDHTARICKLSESRGAAAKDSHPQKQRFCLAHREELPHTEGIGHAAAGPTLDFDTKRDSRQVPRDNE